MRLEVVDVEWEGPRRLEENLAGRFYHHLNLSVYFGRIEGASIETIRVVESILISTHMPALNRRHLDGAVSGAERYLVRNWGFLGSLESACIAAWE